MYEIGWRSVFTVVEWVGMILWKFVRDSSVDVDGLDCCWRRVLIDAQMEPGCGGGEIGGEDALGTSSS